MSACLLASLRTSIPYGARARRGRGAGVGGVAGLGADAGWAAGGCVAAGRGAILVDAIEANAKVAKTIQSNATLLVLD